MYLHAYSLLSLSLVLPLVMAFVKRDVPIGTLTVPLVLSDDRTYTVQVHMGPQASPQTFNFSLSTTLGYSIVAGVGCSSCNSSASYDPSKSTSAANLAAGQSVALGNGLAVGHLVKENCSLQQTNGSVWAYPNQTLIQVDSTNSSTSGILSPLANGIFGLGLTAPNLTFPDTIFGGFFHRNPHTNSFQYGIALNPPYPSATGTQIGQQSTGDGVLHWLQPDSSAYQGNISWGNVVPSSQAVAQPPIASSTDWTVQLDAWTATAGSGNALTHTQPSLATVEPYFPEIYLPFADANGIYALVSGAVSTTHGNYVEWTVPCTSDLTWVVSFGGAPFPVPSSNLIIPRDGACVGAIRGWSDPTESTYLLGSTFMSAFYFIFSVTSANNTTPNQIGMVQRRSGSSAGKSTPIGAIVGGVIGGIALLALIGFGIWFMRRRSQPNERPTGTKETVPFIPQSPPPSAGYKGSASTRASYATDMANGPTQYATFPPSPSSATYNQSSLTPPPSGSAISITQRSSPYSVVQRPSPVQERQDLLSSPTSHHHTLSSSSSHMGSSYVVEPLILPPVAASSTNSKARMAVQRPGQGQAVLSPSQDSAPPPEYSSSSGTVFGSSATPAQNFRDEKSRRG